MPTYPTPIISRKHGPVINLVASQTTDLPCLGAALAIITVLQAGATSNHTLQISTHEGDQFSNVSAEQLDGTYSAPGDTIAFSANKVYMVPVTGAVVFRITTAASSTASVVVSFLTAAEAQAYVSQVSAQFNGHKVGTLTTMLSTQLNALASAGVSALSSAYNNSAGLYNMADFEAFLDYQASPTAGTQVELYLCPSLDATNYADGGDATLINSSHYVGGFTLRAVTDPPQRITLRGIALPFSNFKIHVKNSGGQAMIAADTNTIKMLPYRKG